MISYNRLVRMIRAGESGMLVTTSLVVRWQDTDFHISLTVAEFPAQISKMKSRSGSWFVARWTGATDNGAGVACAR